MRLPQIPNILILALTNACAFVAVPLGIFAASLVGKELAPTEQLATAPMAATIIGTACGIWPVSVTTTRFGRKFASFIFLWIGALACYLCGLAISLENFWLFCLASFFIGWAIAAMQQFRYAAIECIGLDKAPTAASIMLGGGIFAAFAGPELAVFGKDFTQNNYEGSFYLGAAAFVLSSIIFLGFKAPPMIKEEGPKLKAPIKALLNPAFCVAVASGAVGYAVMSFVMTATPISMHHHYMHSLDDTKWVIQSHIMAMFLPALISPLLFRWFGIKNLMVFGILAYIATIIIGFNFTSVWGFWVQLVVLGIGWNFLFTAGTSMLGSTHRPEHKLKAQAVNDSWIFGLQAVASIGAGFAMSRLNWAGLISLSLLPLAVLIALMIWNSLKPYHPNGQNLRN